MSLENGRRLGPYEIVGLLGAGGMGEVYRARDTRLHREVAVKVLSQSFVADPEWVARFEREARATAALQHPNVVTIHDYGIDGIPFLVTELLEGNTLEDRLASSPVPPRRALAWSRQILRGLAAAHARGIIHRDLKPSNIFIAADDSVKVLDFGLAKMVDYAGADSPTARLSRADTVLGTPGYMSPEQVRGEFLDARSDIFSFAVVLQEMLTGQSPFLRPTIAETVSATLRDDPPPLASPPHSAALAATLFRCLDKSAEERFHSAHDLGLHLESIELSGESGPQKKRLPVQPVQLQQVTYHRGNVLQARFARDGSIVYGAAWGDRPAEVFVSHAGSPDSRPLGIAGSVHAVSSTGELAVSLGRRSEIGFLSVGTLARVGIAGGAPRPIANNIYEADWSPDGKQLAVVRGSEGGYRIEFPIGKTLYESSGWMSHLRFSPEGDRLAFLQHQFSGDNHGHVQTVDLSGHSERLTGDLYTSWGLAWHPLTGEIWYSAAPPINGGLGSNVMIYGVAPGKTPREVFASVGAVILHDISREGAVLLAHEILRRNVVAHTDGTDRELSWYDWSFPMRLSPDGSTLLFEEQGVASGGRYAFYVRDTTGGPAIRLDDGRGRDLSSDGAFVLALTNDPPERLLIVPTGAGDVREIAVAGIEHFMTARFLPGEEEVVLVASRPSEGPRLWKVSVQGGEPQPISQDDIASWFFFGVSPDGQWVAAIRADQTPMLYPTNGGEARRIHGAEEGDFPVHWSRQEELLVCRRESKRSLIYALDLQSGQRTLVHTLAPMDPAGVEGVYPIHFGADYDTYVFGYRIMMSSLFLATGLT